jgi:hypothetical protein
MSSGLISRSRRLTRAPPSCGSASLAARCYPWSIGSAPMGLRLHIAFAVELDDVLGAAAGLSAARVKRADLRSRTPLVSERALQANDRASVRRHTNTCSQEGEAMRLRPPTDQPRLARKRRHTLSRSEHPADLIAIFDDGPRPRRARLLREPAIHPHPQPARAQQANRLGPRTRHLCRPARPWRRGRRSSRHAWRLGGARPRLAACAGPLLA